MNTHKARVVLFLVCFIGIGFSSLEAKAADDPAGSDQAGALERELRERKERKRLEEFRFPEIESRVEEEKAQELPSTEFQVSTIRIEGNTVFPNEILDPLKVPYENQTTSLVRFKELAKEITAYYRMRGYVTSRAVIPEQKLEQGQAVIRIVEGKIGTIKIEGLRFSRESMIRRRFRIRSGDILRYQDLERYVTNLNANPDRKVRIVLLPGEKPETTDIVLKVEEEFPLHASYGFTNLGTDTTGRIRQSGTVTVTNLLGLDDQLTSRVEVSERRGFMGWANSYMVPINARGDIFTIDVNDVLVKLGKDLKPFHASGRAFVLSPTLIMPIFHGRYLSGEWTMGFDYKRIRTLLFGIANSKDDLRVFRFGPNFLENDPWGRSILTNEVQTAFAGFLGGLEHNDPIASRREADGYFWQYNVTFGRLQNIWKGTQAVGRIGAQFSPHRLVPAQQFRIGGFDTVRGYGEGEYLGDYGFQGSLELRVPPYFIPKDWKWPAGKSTLRDTIRGVGFIDFGKGFLNSPFLDEEKNRQLIGVGGGLRVSINRNVQARVDWGVPVGEKPNEGHAHLIHFALNVGY